MTGISLPTLAGIARMVPVHDEAQINNVGANWSAIGFTVPTGRVVALDWIQLVTRSGTVPFQHLIRLTDTAAVIQARLVRESPGTTNNPTFITNTIWLVEGWHLVFNIGGGDDTTDVMWSFSGRLFDWVDVT